MTGCVDERFSERIEKAFAAMVPDESESSDCHESDFESSTGFEQNSIDSEPLVPKTRAFEVDPEDYSLYFSSKKFKFLEASEDLLSLCDSNKKTDRNCNEFKQDPEFYM